MKNGVFKFAKLFVALLFVLLRVILNFAVIRIFGRNN